MSKRHRIKGGATDQAFQEQGNLWERGVPAGVDFDLFNCQDLSHAQEHKRNAKEKGGKKSLIGLF